MRRLALLLLAACNQILGLDQTAKLDAPSDAQAIRTNLVWAIATTDGMPDTSPDSVLVYAGIGSEMARPGTPKIQVGDMSGLAEVAYDVADGGFDIPFALRTAPHRIIYTLPGESVPHEVQWSVAGAYLTVPRTTRLDPPAVPPDSGYMIMPAGLGFSPNFPAVATSGVVTFTLTASDIEPSTGTFTYRFANKAKPMAGPIGAPQSALGDWVLVMNWAARSASQASVDGYAIAKLDLAPSTMTMPATPPTWQTTERTLSNLMPPPNSMPTFNAGATKARIDGALGGLAGTYRDRMMYGVSPSLELPAFLPGAAPDFIDRPLIIPFVDSTAQEPAITLVDPSEMLPTYARVIYSGIMTTRMADGVALTSALQSVSDVFAGPMPYPAPFAKTITFGGVDLSGPADDVSVPVSSSMRELKFNVEPGLEADDFVVTLYQITNGQLAPIRIYHVLEGSVHVDSTLLVSGSTYVFGITSRHGVPGADRGDYHKAAYPFAVATTFPRTFVIN